MSNEEKLVKILKFVSEYNDFYKNRIKQYGITNPLDITQWPILTRKELQKNRYNMFSDGYKSKYLNFQLRRHSSSGTSGIPVNVYWSQEEYTKSILSLWRKREKWYHVTTKDSVVSFDLPRWRDECDFSIERGNKLMFNAALLTSEERYIEAARHISRFNPSWIYIQPFILSRLVFCYKKYGIDLPRNVKYIESVGEILTKQLKLNAEKFFCTHVANMYGSQEHNGIAFECPYGKMHILNDNVFVENNAIITNLNNYAFPLIRYEQGDDIKISVSSSVCRCGMEEHCIDLIGGRHSQSFNANGKEINAYLLSDAINIVNNQFNGMISEYLFEYSCSKKTLQCTIQLNCNSGQWPTQVVSEVYRELNYRVPMTDIKISVSNDNHQYSTRKPIILSIIS